MSTTLLYHAFGIRGYRHVATEFIEGAVVLRVEQQPNTFRCATCGSEDVVRRGKVFRIFRHLPIGSKPVWIALHVARLGCRTCGAVRQASIGFANPKRRHTRAFARYALELSRSMTIQDVAFHLGVSWDVIKEFQKEDLKKRFSRPKLKRLRRIAIDEISIGKGHRYLTVVLDLDSGVVVFVGDGKGADALLPFWRRLRSSGAKVKAVAMDMSQAYIQAVQTHLPKAVIVFDHFHIVKLLNDKLSTLRRQMYAQATDDLKKKVLKGTRWLLLKHPENLSADRNERARLEEALRLNEPLAVAYYLKEDLRQLWEQPHKTAARNFLTSWYMRAMDSGIRVIQQFARTLASHGWGILNWFQHPISTGPLEGTNNKIRTMQRQAYGFRDSEFLKLKIYGIHQTKYALVG